jgi:chromate reductase
VVKVLGISGSLRQASFNTALLEAARAYLPRDWSMDIVTPRGFPIYDEELQHQGWPSAALDLAAQIRGADLVVVATPEYNYSIPGGLKNAIDWISRLPEPPFKGKAVGVMGASSGRLGTVRAQAHLRQCFQFLDARVLNKPEVFVGFASQIFQDGRLIDDATGQAVQAFINALADFAAMEKAIAWLPE